MREGHAKVWTGDGKVLKDTEKPENVGKVHRTKAQFMEEWNKLDEAGKVELVRTTIPVEE